MDADVKNIIVFINQPDGLLLSAVVVDDLQAIKPAHTVVNVCDIISRFQVIQLLKRQCLFPAETFAEAKLVITVKYLVVGIANQLQVVINEPGAQTFHHRLKMGSSRLGLLELNAFKDGM